jgi:hypothetical protein
MGRNLRGMRTALPPHRSVLWSFKFVSTAAIGSLVMALVSALGPVPAQLGLLGALISILAGLFLSFLEQDDQRERQRAHIIEKLALPLAIAPDPELYGQYLAICRGLTELAGKGNPILREIALLKLASVSGQIGSLAGGTVVFAATESWRTVYEKLLRSPDVREYRSIAWVKTRDYWQDPPGRQSMQVNFEVLHEQGVLIERLVVIRDNLWPEDQALPPQPLLTWIQEQHNNGLWIMLVRESVLEQEPDLLIDMGIYGAAAVGVQELDERSRTTRFTLDFGPEAVRLARDRWQRALLYAAPFNDILDRLPRNG